MNAAHERLAWLFHRYFEKTATPEERAELAQLLEDPATREEMMTLLGETWNKYKGDGDLILPVRSEQMLESILGSGDSSGRVIRMQSHGTHRNTRIAIAAAVVLMVVCGLWLAGHRTREDKPVAVAGTGNEKNVAPGHNGAVLTLDNGRQIVLDSVHNGLLAQQGSSRIFKQADGLNYHAEGQEATAVYNTISTPRGRQYPNLVLSDGTKVWLDAASSIRFPVAFTGAERKVEITGQAWFEVVHNAKMPFKVMAKGTEISDLGTQFNVNAYEDETNLTVTLLQGLISIKSVIVRPGQQAQVGNHGEWNLADHVNTGEVMAWKNGYFSFQHADLRTVMRQISRWYDLDVRFEGTPSSETFSGKIGRDLSLADLLEGLAQSRLHYRIEDGKKMVIFP